jgi:riboflavin synthase
VRAETSAQITIKAPQLAPQIKTGDSVSVDGVCLTATAVTADSFTADAMVQTLSVTSLGQIQSGSAVNLELAARLDARMGGHIVQGHVDGTGTLVALTPGEQWMKCEVKVDKALLKYIVAKGSICFSGISLTVGEVNDETSVVTVWLIPETLERTTIGTKSAGDVINIEVDVLAKYVERMMEKK